MSPFIANNVVKAFINAGINTFPAKELSVCAKHNFLDTAWQLSFDLPYEFGNFFTTHGLSFSKFSKEILPRFINETKDRAVAFFTSVFGIMALSPPLLMAIKGFHSRIRTQMNLLIVKAT
jgi:hypothetical protein